MRSGADHAAGAPAEDRPESCAGAVYVDCNAGAPLLPAAAGAMAAVIDQLAAGGNPSSQHRHGRALRQQLETARDRVAALAGAGPEEVVFTSCATEAAASVLAGDWDRILYSGLEHACIRQAAGRRGETIPVTAEGRLDLPALRAKLAGGGGRTLLAISAASHETGILQPVAAAAAIAGAAGAEVFCDAAQLLGRGEFGFRRLGIGFAGLSSAKIGGPPGVGALLVASGRRLPPLLAGGGQEGRRRAGTENSVGIAGFGAAAAASAALDWGPVAALRDRMEAAICRAVPGARVFGARVPRLPNVSCLALPGWQAAALVMALDLEGYSVGAGSACASGAFEPTGALLAMDPEGGGDDAAAAIRLSLPARIGVAEVDGLVAAITRIAGRRLRLAA